MLVVSVNGDPNKTWYVKEKDELKIHELMVTIGCDCNSPLHLLPFEQTKETNWLVIN